jgi:hypothetical protein
VTESVSSLSELLIPTPPKFRLGLWVALLAEQLRPVVDLTVAADLGWLVFGNRPRGYGWFTGFDGYNRVFSWHCCFHFCCHNRESSWWSEGQSEQFGSVDGYMLVAQSLDPTTFPQCSRLPTRLLIDNKDKAAITEGDIKTLIRDTKERHAPVCAMVAGDESQLRQVDHDCRWSQEAGIWVLRSIRSWLRRDLDVLRPLLERMRTEGVDFLQKNAAMGEEVRRTLVDLDEVDKELKKAANAIDTAAGLTGKYRVRLQSLCESTGAQKKMLQRQQDSEDIPQTVSDSRTANSRVVKTCGA